MTATQPEVVAVHFSTAAPGGPVRPDELGHVVRNGELVMLQTDAAGTVRRYCSTCILHVQAGAELLR